MKVYVARSVNDPGSVPVYLSKDRAVAMLEDVRASYAQDDPEGDELGDFRVTVLDAADSEGAVAWFSAFDDVLVVVHEVEVVS